MQCPKCRLENPPSALRCDCGYDFQSRTVEQSYLSEQELWGGPKQALTGIGGWLILPAIAVVLSLLDALGALLATRHWAAAAWLAVTASVAAAFFMKKRWLPPVFIAFLIANVAVVGTALLTAYRASDAKLVQLLGQILSRTVAYAALWIPYFLTSKRVKLTFVR